MTGWLWYVIPFILAIGVLVTFHEFGHFVVARLCGVRVLRFSLGFGKPLLRWQKGPRETEWVLAAIPLGGYVKMLDEREAPVEPSELSKAFNRKPVLQRIAIVAAGPLANFLLAVLIYWGTFVHGVNEPRAVLAKPAAETAAARAGFADGDLALAVGDRSVRSWNDFRWELLQRAVDRGQIAITVRRGDGVEVVRQLDAAGMNFDDQRVDPLARLGFSFRRPPMAPYLAEVRADSPAAAAGLQQGDRIVSIDGQAVTSGEALIRAVAPAIGRDLSITYRRGDSLMQTRVRPRAEQEGGKATGRIGVSLGEDPQWRQAVFVEVVREPLDALIEATRRTGETAVFSLRLMGRMITGDVSIRNISGPVTIADYAGQSARMGLQSYIGFLALISISIGVLNLLPIPLLDGGHIMYYLAEIALRRPVPQRVQEIGQQIGFAALAMLMAFAFINDITRLLS